MQLENDEAGRFWLHDVPGVPSPAEAEQHVRTEAERIAREMFPDKFKGYPPGHFSKPEPRMIDEDEFNRRAREAGLPLGVAARTPVDDITLPASRGDNTPANPLATLPPENAIAVGQSPISRLFTAVRAVIASTDEAVGSHCDARLVGKPELDELKAAFSALQLGD